MTEQTTVTVPLSLFLSMTDAIRQARDVAEKLYEAPITHYSPKRLFALQCLCKRVQDEMLMLEEVYNG